VLVRPSSLNSSDPSKVATLATIKQLGVQLVPGDITSDDATLVETLRGFDTVISTIEITQLRVQIPLVKAAVAAGVRHFIPSEFAFGIADIGRGSVITGFDDKLDVRDAVRQTGINYTFIEVGLFAEYLISPFFGVNIADGTVSAPGSMSTRVTVTSIADIGALTAAAVLSPAARNQTIRLAGDTVSYNDIAATLESLTNKTVKRSVRSVADIEATIANHPDDMIARFNLLVANGTGLIWDRSTSWNGVNVKDYKTQTIADLLRQAVSKLSA